MSPVDYVTPVSQASQVSLVVLTDHTIVTSPFLQCFVFVHNVVEEYLRLMCPGLSSSDYISHPAPPAHVKWFLVFLLGSSVFRAAGHQHRPGVGVCSKQHPCW